MLLNSKANELLYVPFNHEYSVSSNLQQQLTQKEFFEHCYYDPNFDELIENIKTLSNEGNLNLTYPVNPQEMIENIKQQKQSKKQFLDWIDHNDIGVYFISGDAGTGKSTFLHNLAYKKQGDSFWFFLDLQSAHTPVSLLNYRICFDKFQYLQQKLSSTLISEISKFIFPKTENQNYDFKLIKQIIIKVLSFYFSSIDCHCPRKEIENIFYSLEKIEKNMNDKLYCNKCADVFYSFFSNMSSDYLDENSTSDILMELYLIILRTLNPDKKSIIVFDNLERFIGVDEIYNEQIHSFIIKLRQIFDNYDQNYKDLTSNAPLFSKNFQFVVAMRHTTTRMFIPQQNSDFVEHMSNLSEWFSIDKIISLKIEWLNNHGIDTVNGKRLMRILSDNVLSGDVLRGLKLKLNALFNNNKRLILDFLISILDDKDYNNILTLADNFYEQENIPTYLSKHTYRMLVWRLVIDKLLSDDLFSSFISDLDSKDLISYVNYMRKILVILSNYSIENRYGYMNFERLLERLYNKTGDISKWFCSDGCIEERKKIYSLLYVMNYYCRRDNNWFQFVDIQCNMQEISGVHYKDFQAFFNTFDKVSPKNINIQITMSGIAYLGYVAHTFEFFSKIIGNDNHLMLCLPTRKQLITEDISKLECIKIIESVVKVSREQCENIDEDITNKHDVLYKKNSKAKPISYSQIIKRSQIGYINLFCDYLDIVYDSNDLILQKKLRELLEKIKNIRKNLD